MYKRPYTEQEIKKNYPDKANLLLKDPVHLWRAKTGIELIHKEPTYKEQKRIWENWQEMPAEQKKQSDQKSHELFGISNEQHNTKILKEWEKEITLYRLLKFQVLTLCLLIAVITLNDYLPQIIRPYMFLISCLCFFILGLAIFILARKAKINKTKKNLFKSASFASVMIVLGIFLHNFFYALAIISQDIFILKKLFNILEVLFFIGSVLIFPAVFILSILSFIIIKFFPEFQDIKK